MMFPTGDSEMAGAMSKRTWLKGPAAVLAADRSVAGNGVVVDGACIVELVAAGERPAMAFDESLDLGGRVLLPGLINTHHHFYQSLSRCVPSAINKPLFPWLQSLYVIWQYLDEEMLAAATELAGLELMLSGATTIADHHYVYPKGLEHALDVQVAAIGKLGCRAMLTRGSMSLGQDQGGLPPESVVQSERTILADSERVIDAYHQRGTGAMLQVALAPCSPFSVSKGLMQDTAALAETKDVLLHTHLAETEDENAFCEREYGQRPLDYLESCDWLKERTWLAHGIHFTTSEIKRLGAAGVGIAHCPSSNMLLGSGTCPSLELLEAGCRFGLAVDGSASNDCSNLIQEARQALLQQRLRYSPGEITAELVLGWATKGSASLLHRDDIGEIAVGKQADLAVFDLNELRFSGAGDPLAALVACGAHRAERVMVAGEWLVENAGHREYLQEDLIRRHSGLARKLQTAC
jgi:8-oxoguanine deaminase